MLEVTFDASDMNDKIKKLVSKFPHLVDRSLEAVANEVLRLSQFEVPHNTGFLQNTGTVELHPGDAIVGYHTVYAARLHEHPEYHFQKGRKGKFLEDPIKNNTRALIKIFGNKLSQGLNNS